MKFKTLSFSIFVSLLIFLIYFILPPFWGTNDEPGMADAIRGIGVSAIPSEYLLFSNNLHGLIIQSIPEFFGVSSYAWATVLVLFLVVWSISILFFSKEYNSFIDPILFFCLAIALAARAIVFPQFTMNAGLLFIAGVIFLKIYQEKKLLTFLIMSIIFMFWSSLIRLEMFMFSMAVCFPFFFNKIFFIKKYFISAAILLVFSLSVNYWSNQKYLASDWKEWKTWQDERVYWMDYGGFDRLLQHPDVYKKDGWVENDLFLLKTWFFADRELIKPAKLNQLRRQVESKISIDVKLKNSENGLLAVFDSEVIVLTIFAGLILAWYRTWRALFALLIAAAGFFYMGWIGRPGQIRVYIPILYSLIIYPIIFHQGELKKISKLVFIILFSFVFVYQLYPLYLQNKQLVQQSEKLSRDMPFLRKQQYIVAWGAAYPYVETFPVLKTHLNTLKPSIYSLGANTLNPYTFAYQADINGYGLVHKLKKRESLLIATDINRLRLLDEYCKTRFAHTLFYKRLPEVSFELYNIFCSDISDARLLNTAYEVIPIN